jgi:hypothetical protein
MSDLGMRPQLGRKLEPSGRLFVLGRNRLKVYLIGDGTNRLSSRASQRSARMMERTRPMGKGSARSARLTFCSNGENAAANEVREPLALFLRQQCVDFLKGAGERFAQPRSALDAALAGTSSLGGVERLTGYGVRILRERSAVIDVGLGSLGLEVVQDPDQRRDLFLVQVEFVGEKSQWAPDTEGGPAFEPFGIVMTVGHETPSALAPIVTG